MKNPEISHAKRVPALLFTSYLSVRQSLVWFLQSTQIPLRFGAFWATKYGVDVFFIYMFRICMYSACHFAGIFWIYFSPFCGKTHSDQFPRDAFKTIEQFVSRASINNIQPWVQGLKTNKLLKCTGSMRQTIKFKEFLPFQKNHHLNITAVL